MTEVYISEPDEIRISEMSPGEQTEVARAISLLGDGEFRESNKVDLCLVEDGMRVWNLSIGRIWMAFVEEGDGSMTVVHISMLSNWVAGQIFN